MVRPGQLHGDEGNGAAYAVFPVGFRRTLPGSIPASPSHQNPLWP